MSDEQTDVTVLMIEDVETWWHGGSRIEGDLILPPSRTGAESTFDIAAKMGLKPHEGVASREHVFLSAQRAVATMFACVHRVPWVYEVVPNGVIELDPDYLEDNPDMASVQCESALIVRRFNPSARDRETWRRTMGRMARKSTMSG